MSTNEQPSRARGVLICALTYLVAGAAAVVVASALSGRHPLLVAGVADLAATVVVFAFAVAFDNSSLYDPYWSVAPVVIGAYWLTLGPGGAPPLVLLALVTLWSARLTWNWLRGWRGLGHEDWRYRDIRGWSGRFYWPMSFLAIMLIPTALVFGGCLSVYAALTAPARPFGVLHGVAVAVIVGAVWIEATADKQLLRFVRSGPAPEAILDQGLWAWCRHPNYLGEISFWWGLWIFGMATDPGAWWTAVGPLGITLLFVFVSLPLIERRMQARRPGYAEHRRRVPALLPRFWRRG